MGTDCLRILCISMRPKLKGLFQSPGGVGRTSEEDCHRKKMQEEVEKYLDNQIKLAKYLLFIWSLLYCTRKILNIMTQDRRETCSACAPKCVPDCNLFILSHRSELTDH